VAKKKKKVHQCTLCTTYLVPIFLRKSGIQVAGDVLLVAWLKRKKGAPVSPRGYQV